MSPDLTKVPDDVLLAAIRHTAAFVNGDLETELVRRYEAALAILKDVATYDVCDPKTPAFYGREGIINRAKRHLGLPL